MPTKFADMEMNDEDQYDLPAIASNKARYPYGLRICLSEKECEKLGLDPHDCETGHEVTFKARCCVTSTSCNDGEMGHTDRVELQIEKMAVVDDD